MIDEKKIICDYAKACNQVDVAKLELDTAKKTKFAIEQKLVEHLRDMDAKTTANYDGIGSVTAVKPKLYASCTEVNKEDLFKWLKEIDRTEIIKPTVHPSSLSSLIREQLEDGFAPPQFVSYYYKESVRFNKAK